VTRVDSFEGLASTPFRLLGWYAVVLEPKQHVVEHRGRDQLRVGVLEDETDLLASRRLVVSRDRRAVDDQLAVVGDERRV
jgi:hypothetical protein